MLTCCLPPPCWWKPSYPSVSPVLHDYYLCSPSAGPSIVPVPLAPIPFSCEFPWAPGTAQLLLRWVFLALGDAGGQRPPGHENIFLQRTVRRCQSDKKREVEMGWRRQHLYLEELAADFLGKRSRQQESQFLCPSCKIAFVLRSEAGPRVGRTHGSPAELTRASVRQWWG